MAQVIVERQRKDSTVGVISLVVAVDLQPMRPIKGVKQIQASKASMYDIRAMQYRHSADSPHHCGPAYPSMCRVHFS